MIIKNKQIHRPLPGLSQSSSQGFSLIELMVAMVVGLIIISGVFSLHSTTRKTQQANEAQMDMVADARFAIELIAHDLRHAGMWGATNRDGLIECKSTDAPCVPTAAGDTPPPAVANDCATAGNPVWAYNLRLPVFAIDGADPNPNPYAASCLQNEAKLANTDILEIRYADGNPVANLLDAGGNPVLDASGNPVANLLAGQMYVRSNFINGRIFFGAPAPLLSANDTAATTNNHTLNAFAYYISNFTDTAGDGIPSLRRVALVNGPTLQNQLLVSGVSDLQVQFGEDLNNDQVVDLYVNPNDVTDWTQVYAAKIWLVMRSDRQHRGINTAKTFRIAGAPAETLGGQDDFRFFMVSSVVDLRNLKQL